MDISSKILASARKTLSERGTARADLALSDYRMLDKSHADILVAYTKEIPCDKELADFVTASFKGKAYPLFETARVYEQQKVVGITVVPPQMTRSQKDSGKMMKMTASTFLDVNDNSEWNLVKNPSTGVSYLARALAEDFESIIKARKVRLGSNMSVTASANFTCVTASYLTANENDYVKFYDGTTRTGTIKEVFPDGVTLKIMDDEGTTYLIKRESVLQVIRKDPEETKKITEDMVDFYSKIWGKDFATQLLKNGPEV